MAQCVCHCIMALLHQACSISLFNLFCIWCNIFRGFISLDGVDIHTVDPTADLQSSRFYSLNRIRAVWSHYMSHQMLYLFSRLFIDLFKTYLEERIRDFSDLSLSLFLCDLCPRKLLSSLGHLLCCSFYLCCVFTHTGGWAGSWRWNG